VSRACREALLHYDATQEELLRLRLEIGQLKRRAVYSTDPLTDYARRFHCVGTCIREAISHRDADEARET
jgi:hypothetical protein